MEFNWINDSKSRNNGAYITFSSHREASGLARLFIYFSRQAASDFNLMPGERVLVGLSSKNDLLGLKLTHSGGNVLKARPGYGSLSCMVTLPIEQLPINRSVMPSEVMVEDGVLVVPFELNAASKTPRAFRNPLKVAA